MSSGNLAHQPGCGQRGSRGGPHSPGFEVRRIYSPGARIAGGADEILRNILAERVLGLPPDIRVDEDAAFQDPPTGRATA